MANRVVGIAWISAALVAAGLVSYAVWCAVFGDSVSALQESIIVGLAVTGGAWVVALFAAHGAEKLRGARPAEDE